MAARVKLRRALGDADELAERALRDLDGRIPTFSALLENSRSLDRHMRPQEITMTDVVR